MINDTGYVRPTYEELLEERIALAKELFGEGIDTSNSSPMGKYIRLWVDEFAKVYEDNEKTYYARFPHTATGQSLDRLMPFAGITRNPPTRAEHVIEFIGTADYEVPVGFLVGTTNEIEFYLINSVTLDENGIGQGVVQCTEFGTVGNVLLGTITEIINPDANISEIKHVDIEQLGKNTESDAALRKRFDSAISGSASGTLSAIRGAVMRVPNVKDCVILENDTNEVNELGIPAHSFETFVYAPDTAYLEIAEAIFSKKPIGISSHGTYSTTVLDVQDNERTIKFSPVHEVNVHIQMSIMVDSTFEYDGVEQIKTLLHANINESSVGQDLIFTTLYSYIYSIKGVKRVLALSISSDGINYNTDDILLTNYQLIAVDTTNIQIEVSDYVDR